MEDEWLVLQQCSKYLHEFKKLTLNFLHSGKLMIYEVFPAIDKLTQKLECGHDNACLHRAVHLACWNALIVLNNYYSKTDESHVHRTALIMHPSYKLQYFKKQNWLQDWIDEAMEVVQEEWHFFQKHFWKKPDEPASCPATLSRRWQKHFSWEEDSDSDNEELDVLSTAGDPLEAYLHSSPLVSIKDPLMWWTTQDPANNPLTQFTIDFLSVPATSVNYTSVRTAMVLGSWASAGLVPEEEIIQGI
ncbi:hypothetical protein ARMSODRAFT_1016771 [Armillaria solidipes]|uniref:HAT C-terminal dimerisation domain-containing protein n=1 Tax=Armillaria solidipes TaxID=1076256 RepID=A0A2H3C0D5_9AGAR|nr:hypothetical protein ARMSODRAFT_1016771 [Armillaria solidipes]